MPHAWAAEGDSEASAGFESRRKVVNTPSTRGVWKCQLGERERGLNLK